MKPELKKLLVLNLPYLLFVYLFAKCGQACGLPHDPHHAGKALPQPGLGGVADGFPAQMDGHSLWAKEPADIPRLTEEVPNRSKRMKTLGNAVSPPQVLSLIHI